MSSGQAKYGKTFGAIPLDNGGVRFSVWSPNSQKVELALYDKSTASDPSSKHDLKKDEATGIFSIELKEAKVGTFYKYVVDGKGPFPDPASRFQPEGVHGVSQVVDSKFAWTDQKWTNIPRDDVVIYELHLGTATPEGSYEGLEHKLKYYKELGVNTLEILPLADFPGQCNWGYDGVCLYAPARCYGTPEQLRHLINAAHNEGLAVLIDIVYNHLGPDGNYLECYSPNYFSARHTTPWGKAPNVDLKPVTEEERKEHNLKESSEDLIKHAKQVRRFFIENALYWIEEFHFDGIRFDATHAIVDYSTPHLLREIIETCNSNSMNKKILFYAEDDRNEVNLVKPIPDGIGLDGLWTDDYHHQVRVMLAKDNESYFREFTGSPKDLVQTVKQGWFYAGQKLVTNDKTRGTDPKTVDDMAQFVYCIQNHDQVGNRALGGRINAEISPAAYKAASSLLLLLPQTPMLFMGQEWAASTPFCFFTDHNAELGKLVTEGRRKEFANFSAFSDPKIRESIPDPQAHSTFASSRLKWDESLEKPHAQVLNLYKKLLELRSTDSCMKNHHRKGFEIFVIQNHTICVVRKNNDNNRAVIAILNMENAGGVNLEKVPELAPYLKGKLELLFTSEDEQFRTDGSVKSPEIEIEGPVRQIFFHGPCAVVLRTQYDANTKFEAPF